ncbi:hypothetical protein GCM10010392_19710 [Streptomyces clavifer]|nr:hypothetical protein GCM10010392_19710 [Streptomyces clavifer]
MALLEAVRQGLGRKGPRRAGSRRAGSGRAGSRWDGGVRGGRRIVHELRVTLGSFMGNLQSHAVLPLTMRRAAPTLTTVTSITPMSDCTMPFV